MPQRFSWSVSRRAAWCSACSAQQAAARHYCAGPALVARPPAKGRSSTGRQMPMAPLMTATLLFAAGTAVLLLLAHRLSPQLAAHPIGFPACKAEVRRVGATTMSSCMVCLHQAQRSSCQALEPSMLPSTISSMIHVCFLADSSAIEGGHYMTRTSDRGGSTAGRPYSERHGSRGCSLRLAARCGSSTA